MKIPHVLWCRYVVNFGAQIKLIQHNITTKITNIWSIVLKCKILSLFERLFSSKT